MSGNICQISSCCIVNYSAKNQYFDRQFKLTSRNNTCLVKIELNECWPVSTSLNGINIADVRVNSLELTVYLINSIQNGFVCTIATVVSMELDKIFMLEYNTKIKSFSTFQARLKIAILT